MPTLARRVVEALGPDERFDTVRLAYFSGDRVDWKDVDVFRRGFPSEAFLYLALNSTESARTYCHWFMDESLRGTSNRLPVGRAIPDRNLSIVDADGRAVAEGEVGEFALESPYIALGYWRAPELMEQAFSLAEDGKSRRLRTGDLGVVRPEQRAEHREDVFAPHGRGTIRKMAVARQMSTTSRLLPTAGAGRRGPRGQRDRRSRSANNLRN